MVKKIIVSFILAAALLLPAPKARAAGVSVFIGGEILEGAAMRGDTTVVPLRSFCETISPGCSVGWDEASRTAWVSADGLYLTARSGSGYITANGRCLYVGQQGFIGSDGVFMLPLRPLAKAFCSDVGWSSARRSAFVLPGSGPIRNGAKFYDGDEVFWLARIISAEAQGESLEGQIAVGNVVMNRVASSDYPNSIYGVIFDSRGGVQFTPVANGTIYDEPAAISVIAAKLVLDGADVAGDCMYFLNEELSTSFWIIENCSYVMTIGNHSFYV